MEPLDDRHYLEPLSEKDMCDLHDLPKPCHKCVEDLMEWWGEMKRETR